MSDPDQKMPSESSAELLPSRLPEASEIPLPPTAMPAPKTPSGDTGISMKHLAALRKKKTGPSPSGPGPGSKLIGHAKTHESSSLVSSVPRASVGKRRPQRRRKLPRDREEDEDCEMEICEDTTSEARVLQGEDGAAGFGADGYVLGAEAPVHEAPSATPSNTEGPDAICFLCLTPVYMTDAGGQTDAAGQARLSSYFKEPIAVMQQQPGMFPGHSPMMGLVPSNMAWEAGGTALSQVQGPAPATAFSWAAAGQGSAASAHSNAWALNVSGPSHGGDAYYPAAAAPAAAHHGVFPPTQPNAPGAHAAPPLQWAPGSRSLSGPLTSGPTLRSQGTLVDLAATGGAGEPWVLLGGLPSTFPEGSQAAPRGGD